MKGAALRLFCALVCGIAGATAAPRPLAYLNPALLRDVASLGGVPNGGTAHRGAAPAGQAGHEFPVVHLFCANQTADESCAYKMGYAHGCLLKEQISAFYTGAWEYLLNTSGIPPAQLPGLLDQTAAATKQNISISHTYKYE